MHPQYKESIGKWLSATLMYWNVDHLFFTQHLHIIILILSYLHNANTLKHWCPHNYTANHKMALVRNTYTNHSSFWIRTYVALRTYGSLRTCRHILTTLKHILMAVLWVTCMQVYFGVFCNNLWWACACQLHLKTLKNRRDFHKLKWYCKVMCMTVKRLPFKLLSNK